MTTSEYLRSIADEMAALDPWDQEPHDTQRQLAGWAEDLRRIAGLLDPANAYRARPLDFSKVRGDVGGPGVLDALGVPAPEPRFKLSYLLRTDGVYRHEPEPPPVKPQLTFEDISRLIEDLHKVDHDAWRQRMTEADGTRATLDGQEWIVRYVPSIDPDSVFFLNPDALTPDWSNCTVWRDGALTRYKDGKPWVDESMTPRPSGKPNGLWQVSDT